MDSKKNPMASKDPDTAPHVSPFNAIPPVNGIIARIVLLSAFSLNCSFSAQKLAMAQLLYIGKNLTTFSSNSLNISSFDLSSFAANISVIIPGNASSVKPAVQPTLFVKKCSPINFFLICTIKKLVSAFV